MSETLLRFLLTELKTVRVICKRKDCGAVTELPVERLEHAFREFKCPLCRAKIRNAPGEEDVFDLLGRAVRKLHEPQVRERIAIEFVLPDKD